MKTPEGYVRHGFRMSDPKSMAKFVEYAGIKNFKLFDPRKREELCEFFGKDLHSSLMRGWRVNLCGEILATVQGNPHGKMKKKKSKWILNILRRNEK